MDNRGEVRAYSEVGEIVFYLAERGEQLVPSTVHGLGGDEVEPVRVERQYLCQCKARDTLGVFYRSFCYRRE